ncbi:MULTISPECIES: PDR/VanB family oxidoreductase [unclassified Caballeronia]|uniref:PDR/VanB family oxidoreductase n=1 Tax=unclassified Caballeronia TaxID=2646786 RepID=UPI00286B1E25|nr:MULTISPECIES: PDR/VanB family oxidoreductase [unclassified Caballeronia]
MDPNGGALPEFTAGAHVDVDLGEGRVRQYSLCNAPGERHRHVIAVLREENGRGGSKTLHDKVRVQDLLAVSRPRNHFGLVHGARRVILLAGGIGVTPLKAMAHALDASGTDYAFHYCGRDAGCAAFGDTFRALEAAGRLTFHFDGGDPSAGLNIAGLLREASDGVHVYYCGPAGFMRACANATQHWPAGTVNCEHFNAPETPDSDQPADAAFTVKLASTGQTFDVPADQTLAEALDAAGVFIETSCQSGLCGSCITRYLAGEVDHRDCILGDDEREQYLTPCVSRAKRGLLVLDL